MRKMLIIKTGSKIPLLNSVPGDFEDWVIQGTRRAPAACVVSPVYTGAPLPPPESIQAVIITGSPAMVTDRLPWMLAAQAWIRDAIELGIPILGICFGHQLLAQALGGTVDYNPNGVEVGTVKTRIAKNLDFDPLFYGLEGELPVQASHRQSVLELPPRAVRLASSERDSNHAYRVGRNIWGLQFHPEFSAAITASYARHYVDLLREQGEDATVIAAGCIDTPSGGLFLSRFATLADARVPPSGG